MAAAKKQTDKKKADGDGGIKMIDGGAEVVSDSGVMGDDDSGDDSDSEGSTLSFNSTQTDMTWMHAGNASDKSEVGDDEDEANDLVEEEANLLTQLGRGMSPSPLVSTPKKGQRRTSRSANSSLNVSHSYNLRRRSERTTDNPLLLEEDEDTFGKIVSKMASISKVRFPICVLARLLPVFTHRCKLTQFTDLFLLFFQRNAKKLTMASRRKATLAGNSFSSAEV